MSQYWLAFSTDDNSMTLERSVINDGRSNLEMFLTDLHMIEGIDTDNLKYELVQ